MQFHKMNVNDLRAYASDTGIRLPGRLTKKDDIILTLGAGDIWRYSEQLGKHFDD